MLVGMGYDKPFAQRSQALPRIAIDMMVEVLVFFCVLGVFSGRACDEFPRLESLAGVIYMRSCPLKTTFSIAYMFGRFYSPPPWWCVASFTGPRPSAHWGRQLPPQGERMMRPCSPPACSDCSRTSFPVNRLRHKVCGAVGRSEQKQASRPRDMRPCACVFHPSKQGAASAMGRLSSSAPSMVLDDIRPKYSATWAGRVEIFIGCPA